MTPDEVKKLFLRRGLEITDEQAADWLETCKDVAELARNYSLETTVLVFREMILVEYESE